MIYWELVIYLSIIPLLLSTRSVFDLINKVSIPQKLFGISLLSFMIFAQLHASPSNTYPFTHWGMYSTENPRPIYYEFQITLNDKNVSHYPFEIISFTSQKAFMRKLNNLTRIASNSPKKQILNNVIKSLVTIFEREYSNKEITKFEVFKIRFKISNKDNKYTETRITQFEYVPG